jgi:outer membrane protein assembly factor BamB
LPGYGQSSPVTQGRNAFVTCIDGAKKETLRVVSVDTTSGKIEWAFESITKNLGENSDYVARGALTPVVDANGIVAGFESGDVYCLDLSGNKRWSLDLVALFGEIKANHGIASSLAQTESLAFIWIQRKENPYLLAIRKETGEIAWKRDMPLGVSWGSPILMPMVDNVDHLVFSIGPSGGSRGGAARSDSNSNTQASVSGGGDSSGEPSVSVDPTPGMVIGIDPNSGQERWRLEGLSGNSSQTPGFVRPGQFLVGASAGRDGGPLMEAIASNGLVQVSKTDTGYSASYVWRSQRATSGFCSPISYRGHAYFTDRRGHVFCFDLETGAEVFNERLNESVWSTPVGLNGNVYFVGETGVTHVLTAGTNERVATNRLWVAEETPEGWTPGSRSSEAKDASGIPKTKPRQYAIATVGSTLLIRRGDVLYGIQNAN